MNQTSTSDSITRIPTVSTPSATVIGGAGLSGSAIILYLGLLASPTMAAPGNGYVPRTDFPEVIMMTCSAPIREVEDGDSDSEDAEGNADDQIDLAVSDPDRLEEGEQAPSAKAVEEMKSIVRAVAANACFRMGFIATYFGELSITWRNEGRMLRLTTFSDDRSPRLDFGTTPSGSLGDYQFLSNVTGDLLNEKIAWVASTRVMSA